MLLACFLTCKILRSLKPLLALNLSRLYQGSTSIPKGGQAYTRPHETELGATDQSRAPGVLQSGWIWESPSFFPTDSNHRSPVTVALHLQSKLKIICRELKASSQPELNTNVATCWYLLCRAGTLGKAEVYTWQKVKSMDNNDKFMEHRSTSLFILSSSNRTWTPVNWDLTCLVLL